MKALRHILALALVFSLLTALSLPAAADVPEILLDQEQTVSVADDESAAFFQFIPKQDGFYIFYSYDCGTADPYGYIMDSNDEILITGDDGPDGDFNFSISCYLTAGQRYYLAATTYSGNAEYCVKITSQPAPTAIRFTAAELTGTMSDSRYAEVEFLPEGCATEELTYNSSNPDIAEVDEFGCIYFVTPGTVTITATTSSGLTATCSATTLTPSELILDESYPMDASKGIEYLKFTAPRSGWYGACSGGEYIDVFVNIYDSDFSCIASDDDALDGRNFYAPFYLSKGDHCFVCIEHYNDSGSGTVTVSELSAPTSISLTEDRLTGYPNFFCQMVPVYQPAASIPEDLTWSSDNKAVATVDQYGYVYFWTPGTAVIRFTSKSGKTDSITVTVTKAPAGSDLLATGICGPRLQWKLNTAGVLTITGEGDMFDDYYTWQDYASEITKVIFPKGITGIGAGAFSQCINLTQIEIPSGVTRIGNNAFSYCTSLEQISLPDTVSGIGYYAFHSCLALKEVDLPAGLTQLGQNAFSSCSALSRVTFPQGLTQIPMACFSECYALTDITLPGNLTYLSDRSFFSCGLKNVTLPQGLTYLGCNAFYDCSLTGIQLPESLVTIQEGAFFNCPLTGEVTLHDQVAYIGSGAFYGSSIRQITFLGDVPVFDEYALSDVNAIAYYPGRNATWTPEVRRDYGGTIEWMAETSGNLSGSVTAKGEVPVTLSLYVPGNPEAAFTVTANPGSYAFTQIPTGSYTLTVSAQNHVSRSYQLTVDAATTLDVTIRLLGDVNADGRVNVGDTAKVYSHARSTNPLTDDYAKSCADVTGDGRINVGDAARLYSHVRNTKPLY